MKIERKYELVIFLKKMRAGGSWRMAIINERLEFDLIHDQFTQVGVRNLPGVNQLRRGERDRGFC